ncbi:MAG: lipoprotein-releasing system ATP-binding protein LolD [Flavobacteriales bacterium]|nr:lipoprotein-releasing system ATP-binding protein LolD [Flavobacteriales bacterium]|tara:strand:+ start:1121 stop:1771 length:651 start_codon:yes stop_codon:yes gene_type:complete
MIIAKNIRHSYGDLDVLKGVNLEINKGEFVSIQGVSGAGKTTLLNILGTLEKIQDGELEINNKNINNLHEKDITTLRNKEIGFVFQFHNLLAEFSALENVMLPSLISGEKEKNAKKNAIKILTKLGMQDRIHHSPQNLSGGEKQRVAIARALINSPSIILADEPSGNLDSKNSEELHKLLLFLNKKMGQTIIVITHNEKLAKIANRHLKIVDGKII